MAVYVAVENRVKGESLRARPTCPSGLQRKLPKKISIKGGPRFDCKRSDYKDGEQGAGGGCLCLHLLSFILQKKGIPNKHTNSSKIVDLSVNLSLKTNPIVTLSGHNEARSLWRGLLHVDVSKSLLHHSLPKSAPEGQITFMHKVW